MCSYNKKAEALDLRYIIIYSITILYVFQDVEQMIPYHLYGWDVQALVWCMNVAQCWTERHHIEVRIAL